jgi:phosphatidylglycerophosphatase A
LTILANPDIKFLFSHPAHFFALGFGSGLAPKAPGTFGTLVGFPIFWLMKDLPIQSQLIIIALLFLAGIYVCDKTGKDLGVSDHGAIVWDEIAAMMLVLTIAPEQWAGWLMAFFLFRLFDIWKPQPIRYFDAKLKNGFGVMFDDLLAAIYAMTSMWLIFYIYLYWISDGGSRHIVN